MATEITAIKERISAAKAAYKDSETRKAVVKAEATYCRLVGGLHKRWGLSIWSARRALGAVPEAMRCLEHRMFHRHRRAVSTQALTIMLE
jgi:hypothetical protein